MWRPGTVWDVEEKFLPHYAVMLNLPVELVRARPRMQHFRDLWARVKASRPAWKYSESDIEPEYLARLWEEQEGRCALTGWTMQLEPSDSTSPNQASLDRIDNQKGYIRGNVRFLCLMANYARNQFDDEISDPFLSCGGATAWLDPVIVRTKTQSLRFCTYNDAEVSPPSFVRAITSDMGPIGFDVATKEATTVRGALGLPRSTEPYQLRTTTQPLTCPWQREPSPRRGARVVSAASVTRAGPRRARRRPVESMAGGGGAGTNPLRRGAAGSLDRLRT